MCVISLVSVTENEEGYFQFFCTDEGSPRDQSGSQHRAGANAEHLLIVPPQTGCYTSPFQSLQSLDESETETETE